MDKAAKFAFDMSELEAKLQEVKEATREANMALRDMKEARKENEKWLSSEQNKIRQIFNDFLKEHLDAMMPVLLKHIETTQERIDKRFDKLADVLLGEDGKYEETLAQALLNWKKR